MITFLKIIKNKFVLIGLFFLFLPFLFRKQDKTEISNPNNLPTDDTSLTDFQAKAMAENCYTAMKGLGTDEPYLLDSLYPLSIHSFNHVYKVFGIRDDENLQQWLLGDLSKYHYKKFKDKFPAIV